MLAAVVARPRLAGPMLEAQAVVARVLEQATEPQEQPTRAAAVAAGSLALLEAAAALAS